METTSYFTPTIVINKESISDKLTENVEANTCYSIEFYEGKTYSVLFTTIQNPSLKEILEELSNDAGSSKRIAISQEYKTNTDQVCVFKFCSQTKALVLQLTPNVEANKDLESFLDTHLFYGKDINFHVRKLEIMFNKSFKSQILDFSRVYLLQYGHPNSFNNVIKHYVKLTPTIELRRKTFSMLKWGQEEFTKEMLIFGVYGTIALMESYSAASEMHPDALDTFEEFFTNYKKMKNEKRAAKRQAKKLATKVTESPN